MVARGRAVLYGLLAVCMAGSVVWQRAATRSAYDQGGRAYTVFGDGVAAGLAADCGDTPVVTDYMIWGGHEVAENAFFLRYGDLDADAHALQIWRTEDHADDEAVYRGPGSRWGRTGTTTLPGAALATGQTRMC